MKENRIKRVMRARANQCEHLAIANSMSEMRENGNGMKTASLALLMLAAKSAQRNSDITRWLA